MSMNLDKVSGPVFSTSQDNKVVGNNQTTNNKTGFSDIGSKKTINEGGISRPTMSDVAKAGSGDSASKTTSNTEKTLNDIVKLIFDSILKDGKIDKGEAEMVKQLMTLLSDVEKSDPAAALGGVKDAGRQPESNALQAGGAAGSQAPPEEADEMAALGETENEDPEAGETDEANAANGSQQLAMPAGNQQPAVPAGNGQAPNVGRQERGVTGGTETSRNGLRAMTQAAQADGNISDREGRALDKFAKANSIVDGPRVAAKALKQELGSAFKDGVVSEKESKNIEKLLSQGGGRNLSGDAKMGLAAKFFADAGKDGSFSKQDMKTFNALMATGPKGGSVEGAGPRASRSDAQPSASGGLPGKPSNPGTRDFLNAQLGDYINPPRKDSKKA